MHPLATIPDKEAVEPGSKFFRFEIIDTWKRADIQPSPAAGREVKHTPRPHLIPVSKEAVALAKFELRMGPMYTGMCPGWIPDESGRGWAVAYRFNSEFTKEQAREYAAALAVFADIYRNDVKADNPSART